MFADFQPAGAETGYTLGHDLSVAGRYDPRPLPSPTRTDERRRLRRCRLDGRAGRRRDLRLTPVRHPQRAPVTDLQPYLGAYGHLVALRDHDLAYLHVHPEGTPGDGRTDAGPDITFDAEVPSTGDFRLFLDFRHGGRVHTAAFTLPGARSASHPRPAAPRPPDRATDGDDAAHTTDLLRAAGEQATR